MTELYRNIKNKLEHTETQISRPENQVVSQTGLRSSQGLKRNIRLKIDKFKNQLQDTMHFGWTFNSDMVLNQLSLKIAAWNAANVSM